MEEFKEYVKIEEEYVKMEEVKEYVNNYLKEKNWKTLDNLKSLESVEVLTDEKRRLINYRMFLIYKKIDESIETLDFSKRCLAFDYVANNEFADRLYKKISEVEDKVIDLTSMLEAAQNGIRPYDKIQ